MNEAKEARTRAKITAVAFVARSGTGKTTLVEQVIAELTSRQYRVGALKHDAHDFEMDHPGKDSHRFSSAGAVASMVVSDNKLGLTATLSQPLSLHNVLDLWFNDADIVLVEGYRTSDLPKIEVSRTELGQKLYCRGDINDPHLIAVVTDGSLDIDVPQLSLAKPASVADFLEERFLSGDTHR